MNRIKLTWLLCFLLFNGTSFASGKPEKVYSIVKQKMPVEWYQTQAQLWAEIVQQEPTNREAWLNFYTAKRMLKLSGGEATQEDLDDIVKRLAAAIPNSYEHHYVTFWNANLQDKKIDHLLKAYAMDPDRPDTYDDLLTYYEINGNRERMQSIAKRWFQSNDISANILAWNYNMLVSTDPNAILLTHGDNDTYPALILQQAQGVRKDVRVLNLSLLTIKKYRERALTELHLPAFGKDLQDFNSYLEFQTALCNHLFDNKGNPVYFSSSIPPELYQELKPDLYNVGLAFKWTAEKFDNIAVTKRNYEKNYLTDYIKVNLFDDLSASVNDQMNASYLMPLLTLHNHYKESEDVAMEEVEELITHIAERSNREEEIERLMDKRSNKVVSMVIDDPREAYLGMVKINDTMYVSECEVMNQRYDLFLLDLMKQRRFDDLNTARVDQPDWMAMLPKEFEGMSEKMAFEHGKPQDEDFPICNVSYEAALLYCQWLTTIHNKLEHRKKRYQEVEFRLLTEAEWEHVASAGKDQAAVKYPWGGPHLRNSLGCYLANVRANKDDSMPDNDEQGQCPAFDEKPFNTFDGGVFTVPVASYSPNDFGLYQLTGNVSEMVQEKGIAKGGNWSTTAEEAVITNKQSYSGPSPMVGFRVAMIVKQ